MGIGIMIGIVVASIVWCIGMLKLNADWGNECLKQILKTNDEWLERCEELIDKYVADREADREKEE